MSVVGSEGGMELVCDGEPRRERVGLWCGAKVGGCVSVMWTQGGKVFVGGVEQRDDVSL